MTQAELHYRKMTQTPVERLIVSLSVPTIISMLISNIYNLADTYFVGSLGVSASGAVGVVFTLMTVLQAIGFSLDSLPYWLKDQKVNNWSLVYSSVWRYLGQNTILFIGAIMSVDDTLYEAASLDGANRFQQFKYVILPSIKTIVTLNIILSISGSLSAFEAPFVITNGQNGTGTYFVVMNTIAHTNQKVGLASAMAVFLLCIIFVVTILQNVLFKYVFRNANEEEEVKHRQKKPKKAVL